MRAIKVIPINLGIIPNMIKFFLENFIDPKIIGR